MIGSGNVAWHWSRALEMSEHNITEIYSRNVASANDLADTFAYKHLTNLEDLSQDNDLIILAVHDDAIKEVASAINPEPQQVIAHTSGTASISEINHMNSGVLWPVQSLIKEVEVNYDTIPLMIYYSSPSAKEVMEEVAAAISNNVHILHDEQRQKLHLAAVITNNFTNHLMALVENYCNAESLNYKWLYPIAEQTMLAGRKENPTAIQTGPAKRDDKEAISKHLEILTKHPDLESIYKSMTQSIIDMYKDKN